MAVRAVFLVGFMASGKSCVGRQLAERLDWDFVDLDTRIEAREGQTIPQIFRERGESGFRQAETNALLELTSNLDRETVVALGGGAFVHPGNRNLLEPWPSVFLDAPVDELWRRASDDATERPLRADASEFARLHQSRLPFYREATVTIVTTGKDPISLCAEIERSLQFQARDKATDPAEPRPASFRTGESQ
jgi:shikimate kinase